MAADLTDDEIYASKYLHGFCEPSLRPHEVMVEIGVPVKLLKESTPPPSDLKMSSRHTVEKAWVLGSINGWQKAGQRVSLCKIKP